MGRFYSETPCIIPEITPVFSKQSNAVVLAEVTDEDCKLVEKLFIILYSKEK